MFSYFLKPYRGMSVFLFILGMAFLSVFLLSSCGGKISGKTSRNLNSSTMINPPTIEGVASWYGGKFHGRRTANGERYNMYLYTVAHKELPFDTWLSVTNIQNNRTVKVRVNDRGPFVGNRVLDLSYAAARALDLVKTGTAEVKAQILGK